MNDFKKDLYFISIASLLGGYMIKLALDLIFGSALLIKIWGMMMIVFIALAIVDSVKRLNKRYFEGEA